MKFKIRLACWLTLASWCTGASAQVGSSVPLADDSGVATVDQEGFSAGMALNGTYFDIRHQSFSGVGYQDGFTQIGAFTPVWGSDNWFIAPNARMLLGDNVTTGFNAGLVARMYSERFDRIFGANVYYDWDQAASKNRYSQIGFGLETLGQTIDARGNVYLPTSDDHEFIRATGLSNNLIFFQNQLGFVGTQLVEQPLRGADAEVGFPVAPSLPWMRAYAGLYGYQQDGGSDPLGFRGRLESWISNDTSVGLMLTHDKVFGTNMNVMVDFRFAGFTPTRWFPNWETRERMLMPVARHWRVSVGQFEENVNIAANNPRTNNPYFVVWVSPDNNGPGGTGTFEDPLQSLPPNVPNNTDLVLVTRGDSNVNPLQGNIALPDYTRLLGEGTAHVVDANATFGPFAVAVNDALLPDARFRNTGFFPFMTNPGGDIVTLGNHNEVASFVMSGAAGAGIRGTNTSGFNLHRLELSGNGTGGIVITGSNGTGGVTADGQSILSGRIADINRNVVPGFANPNGLGNNGTPGGIVISTGIAPLDLTIDRVSMNATPGNQDFGVRLTTQQGALNVAMNDVEANGGNAVAGISIEQNTGRVDATLLDIEASNNAGIGLRLLSGNLRPMNVVGSMLTVDGNAGDNLQIGTTGGLAGTSAFTGQFSDSTFNGSTAGNGIAVTVPGGTKSLLFTRISASGNALDGLDLAATGGATSLQISDSDLIGNTLNGLQITATGGAQIGNSANAVFDGVNVVDSTLTGNGLDAINTFVDGASHVELFVDPTDLSTSGRHGLRYEVRGGSTLVTTIDQATINNSGAQAVAETSGVGGRGRGVFGLVDGLNSQALININDVTMQNSADDGVFLRTSGGASAVLNIANTFVVNSGAAVAGASGIEVQGASGSTLTANLTGTTRSRNTVVNGTSDFGLTVGADGAGTTVTANATGTILTNAGTSAVAATATANGHTIVNLTNVSGTNSGVDGLLARAATNGLLEIDLDTADFSRAGRGGAGDGLNAFVQTGAIFNACITDSHFDNANSAGLGIVTTGVGSETNIHFATSTANSNDDAGILSSTQAGASMNFRSVGSNFDNNGTLAVPSDGVIIQADGVGTAVRTLFNTTSASDNLRNGFSFIANNGAFMTNRLDSITAQNNQAFGVRLDATGAGTNAILIPEGTNVINNNTLGSYSINYTGTNLAIIGLTGSFDSQAGDGVSVTLNNVGTALVSLTGNGTDTINANGGDGVDIRINGATQAGVLIDGYSDISSNTGGDGVHVELSNVTTAAAVELRGPVNLVDNSDDGVEILLNNVVLGQVNAPPGLDPLSVISLTDNDPLNVCVPEPTTIPFANVVAIPAISGISLDQLTIDRTGGAPAAGQNGIDIVGTGVTGAGTVSITNSTIDNFDSGIRTSFSGGSTFGGLNINAANVTGSSANGIDVVMTASGAPITISGSTVSGSTQNGVRVTLAGATGGFDIDLTDLDASDNTTGGVVVSGSGVIGDLSLTNVTTNNTINGTGTSIALTGGTADSILLTNVTSNNNTAGAGIDVSLANMTLNTQVTINGQGTATANNNGTDGIRVGLTNVLGVPNINVGGFAAVDGNQIDGIDVSATGTNVNSVDLSDNVVSNSVTGNGISLLLNSNIAGSVTMDNNTVDASGLDGIRITLDGVTGGANVSTTNSNIDGNGAIGINFSAVGATLGNVTLDPIVVSDSQLDGVRYDLTNTTFNNLLIDQVTISDSGISGAGDGLEVILDGATGNAVTVRGVSINAIAQANAAEDRGINIHGSGALNLGNISISDSISNSTRNDAGVALLLDNGTVGSISLDNVSANDSGAQGIRVSLGPLNVGPNIFIRGQGTATANDNARDGVSLVLSNVVGTPNVRVSGYNSVDSNGGRGIGIQLSNNPIGSLLVDDNTITQSGGRGLDVILDGVTASPNIIVRDTTASNSGGRGISVAGNGATLGNVQLTNVSSTVTNADEGVAIVLNGGGTVGRITLTNTSADQSAAGGILVDLNNETIGSPITLAGGPNSFSTNNGGDGIRLNLNTVTGTPNIRISDYANVDNNAGNGIALLANGNPVGSVNLSNNAVSNSTAGDGIRIDLSNSAVGTLTADGNTVSDSNNRGVNVILDGVTGPPNIAISNTTVTNSGAAGVSVSGTGVVTQIGNVTLTNVSSDSTTSESGISVAFDTLGTIVGNITLRNVSGQNSAVEGILVNLNGINVNGSVILDGQNTAQATGNTGTGIQVTMNGITGTPDVRVNNYLLIDQNAGRGIGVITNGSAVDSVEVSGNIVSNSTAGQGVQIDLTGSAVNDLTVAGNTISDSFDRGLDIILDGVTTGPTVDVSNTTVTNSGGRGVSISGLGSAATAIGDITLTNVSSDTTTADEGVALTFNTAGATVGNIALNNVSAQNSFATGILVDLDSITTGQTLSIDGLGTAVSSGNGTGATGDGIFVNLTNVLTAGGPPNVNVSIDNYAQIDSNSNSGIALTSNGTNLGNVSVSNNAFIGNSGATGIALNLAGNSVGGITVDTNVVDTSAGRGVDLVLDNLTGSPVVAVSNTTVTNSGGRGVSISGDNATLGDVQLTFVSSDTTTAEEGVAVSLTGNGTVGSILLNDVSSSNSFSDGILINLNAMNVGPNITVDGQGNANVNGNGTGGTGDGIHINLVNTVTGTPIINVDNHAGISGNAGNGIRLTQNNSNITSASISGNTAMTANTSNGIVLELLNNSDLPTATISNNLVTQSGGDGFRMVNPNAGGTAIALTFEDNTFSSNTGSGVEIDIRNNENVTLNFNSVATGNQISSNGTAAGTTGFGIHVSAINNAQYALNVGGAGPVVNTLDGNRNAGIGVQATDNTVGTISVANTTISNTLAGGNASFAGDGLAVRLAQQANVTAMTVGSGAARDTTFSDNAGDGFSLLTIENSQLSGGLLIQNTSTTDNRSDGISITRRDNSMLSNDANNNNIIENGEAHIVLNNVLSTGNTANGLNVIFTNAQLPMTRIDIADTTNDGVADSQFDSNGTGIRLTGSADAVLVVNVSDTSASHNDNGVVITLTEDATLGNMIPGAGNVNNPASIASTFNGMTISDNANNGFALQTNNDSLALITMTNSALTGARNTFDINRGNGIQITANGNTNLNLDFDAVDITNSTGVTTGDGVNITTNTTSSLAMTLTDAIIGNTIPSTVQPGMSGDGIDITTNSSSSLTFNLGDNLAAGQIDVGIYGNSGNGIVIRNNGSSNYTGTLNNVHSRFNDGRGYSALMTKDTSANGNYAHNIDDSSFGENGREGLAFITNAGTHNQNEVQFSNTNQPVAGQNDRTFPIGDGNDFLNTNTDLQATLVVTNSSVQNNGTISNSNGLVLAVGTNSKVNADIRGNTFGGNSLDDFATRSFTTTDGGFDAAGNVTGTAIQTNASINRSGANTVDSVFQDDTAQLDLRFLQNTGDQINVTSLGATYNVDAAKNSGGNPRRADIFQVNAFHSSTMQAGSTNTSIISNPADVAALDASATDPLGIVNVANFYQNVNPNSFTPVRIQNVTSGGAIGLIASNNATGTFDLTGNPIGNVNAGDVFRVFLLDTNVFNQSGAAQNVNGAFNNNYFGYIGANTSGPATVPVNPTPLATYFNFPDAVFP